jgi:hypothetical protein
VCDGGHRFFIPPEPPNAADSATAGSRRFPEVSGLSTEAIASFWLSDPKARSVLNEQLAQLLRAILEKRNVLDEPSFSFCPICGASIADYDQPDIWVQGLRCPSGHSWALRSDCLFSVIGGRRLELQAEHSDAAIGNLIDAWLKSDRHMATNLHESIRRVLTGSPLCPNK